MVLDRLSLNLPTWQGQKKDCSAEEQVQMLENASLSGAKPTHTKSYPVPRHTSLSAPTALRTSLETPQEGQVGYLPWYGTRTRNMVPDL